MLRYILILAAHSIIKYSKKMRSKYLSLVRRLGKNRAIVAIARILIEIIFLMLTRHEKYNDENDQLTEKKIHAMSLRAMKERNGIDLKSVVNLLRGKNMVRMST